MAISPPDDDDGHQDHEPLRILDHQQHQGRGYDEFVGHRIQKGPQAGVI